MITKEKILNVLKKVKDPEMGIDIVTMNLVRDVKIKEGNVKIKMTMTTPFCPYAGQMVENAKSQIKKIKGVKKSDVELVFDPPWEPSDEIKEMLGLPL